MYQVQLLSFSSSVEVCTCVTFLAEGKNDQFIVHDLDPENVMFRGISASDGVIRIWGVKNESSHITIPYSNPKRKWITIFVRWPNIKDECQLGSYSINNEKFGTFESKLLHGMQGDTIYLKLKVKQREFPSWVHISF